MFASLLLALTIVGSLATIPEEFDSMSVERGYTIGWLKVLSCTEGGPYSTQTSTFTYPHGAVSSLISEYFEDVVAVQILSDSQTPLDLNNEFTKGSTDSLAVMTKVCSNPVLAVNIGRELSYVIDVDTHSAVGLADMDNWLGSDEALSRLPQNDECTCSPADRSFESIVYHACCSHDGLHLNTNNMCYWDWRGDEDGVAGDWQGAGISLWVGFDALRKMNCAVYNTENTPSWYDGMDSNLLIIGLVSVNILAIVCFSVYICFFKEKRPKYQSVKAFYSSADDTENQQLNIH